MLEALYPDESKAVKVLFEQLPLVTNNQC